MVLSIHTEERPGAALRSDAYLRVYELDLKGFRLGHSSSAGSRSYACLHLPCGALKRSSRCDEARSVDTFVFAA